MAKDVILDRYGRLYEFPHQLAKLGHQVSAWCLDYHSQSTGKWIHYAPPGTLLWESRSLGTLKPFAFMLYARELDRRLSAFKPDLLIGASDIPHVVLARWLSQRLAVPYAIDLYDNFESFGQARIPGFTSSLRWAVRGAVLITATSAPLQQKVLAQGVRGTVVAMPSSVDHSTFYPGSKRDARAALGLPLEAELIGTAGGLYRAKGIESLYSVWPRIAESRPNAHLVLAGPLEHNFQPPSGAKVHYLGNLPHADVANLFRALDVGIISILDTSFGRYCFPQKAYEMLACNLPVVASDVGQMRDLFANTPQILFDPTSRDSLFTAICTQLDQQIVAHTRIQDWPELICKIDGIIQKIVAAQR